MRELYTEKLAQLKNEVLELGMLCEQAIMKTYRLLISDELREVLLVEVLVLHDLSDSVFHHYV